MERKDNTKIFIFTMMLGFLFLLPAVYVVVVFCDAVKEQPAAEIIKPDVEKVVEVKGDTIIKTEQVKIYVTSAQGKTAELTEPEIELLARLVHAEAGNQDPIGKRLVADVILNRIDSDRFPDNLMDVVTAAGQFTEPATSYTDSDMDAVKQELGGRLDENVLYFRTGYYHKHGTPAYQHGAHYFSGG